jgi:hypothetical protein
MHARHVLIMFFCRIVGFGFGYIIFDLNRIGILDTENLFKTAVVVPIML